MIQIEDVLRNTSFSEICQFLSMFIHHYSQITESLTELLRDSVKNVKISLFIWLSEAKQAFN